MEATIYLMLFSLSYYTCCCFVCCFSSIVIIDHCSQFFLVCQVQSNALRRSMWFGFQDVCTVNSCYCMIRDTWKLAKTEFFLRPHCKNWFLYTKIVKTQLSADLVNFKIFVKLTTSGSKQTCFHGNTMCLAGSFTTSNMVRSDPLKLFPSLLFESLLSWF